MKLSAPIHSLKGIGEKTAKAYERLHITTVEQLLQHFPRDYERFAPPTPIGAVREGELVTIEGMLVSSPKLIPSSRKKLLLCHVKDATGTITLKWFNQPYLRGQLPMGTHLIFRGRVAKDAGQFSMIQPEIYSQATYRPLLSSLRPVYPLTEGLSRNAIAKAMRQALEVADIEDAMLPAIRKRYGLMKLKDAYEEIHFPKAETVTKDAVRRLAFDEFFYFLVGLQHLKELTQSHANAYPMMATSVADNLLADLPYQLTNAQLRAYEEMLHDMRGDAPMQRLLQGDVGSGKTILALLLLATCAENGFQGALMAPTEVLAVQHHKEFVRLLEPYGIRVELLTGSMSAPKKREVLAELEAGRISILIGTHALFQERVAFEQLGLVIVDEQHRFGVKQRERLLGKGDVPHLLIMSATPIPRTLAMMLYGDMDLSVLDELPKDRLPIKSCVVDTSYRPRAYRFLQQQLAQGRQAYVICPLIEESEGSDGENVADYAERLQKELPSSARIGILHGKLPNAEKNRIMQAFAEHELDILVSTTVIEVGINVPNATVIMIENAERFGLSGLHQLRGRVGRGSHQSYCILVQGNDSEESRQRLNVLLEAEDGFRIAEEDLRLRGPGDFFGIRQSGDMNFRMADLIRDAQTLRDAKEAVETLSDAEYSKIMNRSVAGEGAFVVY